MDATELNHTYFSELVTGTFSADWSEDNQISVITTRGIHIFEILPNPLSAHPLPKFKRSFLYASDHLPTAPFIPVLDSALNQFEREDFYLSILEESLTPKIPDKSDHVFKVITVAWSPKALVRPSKCLLAILTSSGAIDLTIKVKTSWFSVCNLSKLLWDTINKDLEIDPTNINVQSLDAKTYRDNARRLVATAITWSPLYAAFSYLVTAYRSCDLVIWKVRKLLEFDMKVEPTIIYRTRFDIEAKISKLLWINLKPEQYLIIVGFRDGRIYGLCILETDDILTENAIQEYVVDPDNMNVSCMKEFSRTDDEIKIIVTKTSFVIVMTLNYGGTLLSQEYIQLLGYSITGLVLIDDNEAIVSTQDSKIYRIKMDNKATLTSTPLKHNMKSSTVQYLGLARAPNGSSFVNVTSPSAIYDHLANREPSTLRWFCLKSGESKLLKLLNDSYHIHWDCLELIRLNAVKHEDPKHHIFAKSEALESLPVHQLRVAVWLTFMKNVLKDRKTTKFHITNISEAQPLIFVHAASSHITKLATLDSLTEDMHLCIYFLRLYLEKFLAEQDKDENNVIKTAKMALEVSRPPVVQSESCSLCGSIITELPWEGSSCPEGHTLPRCALTFLQITCLNYRQCSLCARIFHPSLDDIYDEVRCLYCDVPAEYDPRFSSLYDDIEENCKNLSIQPIQETQESETLEDGKKKARTTDDPFTSDINEDLETLSD